MTNSTDALIARLRKWLAHQVTPPTVEELAKILREIDEDNVVVTMPNGSIDASGHRQDVENAIAAIDRLNRKNANLSKLATGWHEKLESAETEIAALKAEEPS